MTMFHTLSKDEQDEAMMLGQVEIEFYIQITSWRWETYRDISYDDDTASVPRIFHVLSAASFVLLRAEF